MRRNKTTGQIVKAIARKIIDGVWAEGQSIPPIRELATTLGVARATMDVALQEAVRQGLVVTEPRKATRVAESAAAAASSVLETFREADRPVRIAVITPAPSEGVPSSDEDEVVRQVLRLARKRGWAVEQVYWPISRRSSFPRLLADRTFDGAFCIVAQPERVMPLSYMRERAFPVVVYNRRLFDLPLPAVLLDGYGAIQQLGSLLCTLGHRKITLLASTTEVFSRFESPLVTGWLDFCRQHDLLDEWEEHLHVIAHPDFKRALRTYLRREPLPTAVILGCCQLANAFLEVAAEMRLRMPQDISVAAACTVNQCCGLNPEAPLTSIRPSMERTAECSIELLARMIAGEPYPPPLRLPYTLVRSDSVGPPRET